MSGNGTFSVADIPLANRRIFEVIPSLYQINQGQGDDLLRQMLGENQFGLTHSSSGFDVELIYRTPLLWPDTLYEPGVDINDSLSKHKKGFVSFKPEYSNVAYTSLKLRYPDRAKHINPTTEWSNIKIMKEDTNGNNADMSSSDLYDRSIIYSDGTQQPNTYALNQQVNEFLKELGMSLELDGSGSPIRPPFSMHNENNIPISITKLWTDSIISIIIDTMTIPVNTFATESYVDTAISNSENNTSNSYIKKLSNVPVAGQFVVTTGNDQLSISTLPVTFKYDVPTETLSVNNINVLNTISVVNPISISGIKVKEANLNPSLPISLIDMNDVPYNFKFRYNGLGLSILQGTDELIKLNSNTDITIPNAVTFFNSGDSAILSNRVEYSTSVKETTITGVENLPDDALLTKSEVLLLIQAAQTSFTPIGG